MDGTVLPPHPRTALRMASLSTAFDFGQAPSGRQGMPVDGPTRRARIRAEGTVQGVGFRPFVYRLATSLGLAGFVRNDRRGVLIEVQGATSNVRRFLDRLSVDAPPLAAVRRLTCEPVPQEGDGRFAILDSDCDESQAVSI